MLIVELDGGYHFIEEQQKEDSIRQDWLEHMGYKVLRFANEQILFDTDNVIVEIRDFLSTNSPFKGDLEGLKSKSI